MKNIPLFKSYISPAAIRNVATLLRKSNSGTYIGEGPEVKAFEKEISKRFGIKNVAAVNSGTSALELAYELAGIGKGDEVITPVLTCTATNLPLIHRGATIVFADTAPDLNIDVDDVRRRITPKTKAVVFVHFGGNNRGLKELLALCKERKIALIEDAAQAILSPFWGKADFTCMSFQAIKTITSGDGGFVACKDPVLYEKAKRLRWFGYDRDRKQKEGDIDVVEAGYKYHMSDITAAIGRANLAEAPRLKRHNEALMKEYKKGGIDAYPWFAMLLTSRREELRAYLAERGIASGMYHYRNDKYSVFGASRYGVTKKGRYPTMDRIENQYLLLPLHIGVTVADVRRITKAVREFNEIHKS